MENPDDFDGIIVGGSLMQMGPRAVKPLIAALKHENKRVRGTAAYVLVQLDDKRAVEPLITVLKGEYHDMLRAEGKAVEGISPSTIEQLIALLKQKDTFYVRSSSAWALGWLGDKRAVEPLVAVIGDPRAAGAQQAAVALGRLGDERAIEPLIRELKRLAPSKGSERIPLFKYKGDADPLRPLVAKTLDALVKIGPPAVEPLIGVLKDENAHVRSFAAEGLGELGDKRSVQPLVALLKDEDEEVRRSATKALSKLGWQPGTGLD
jgi:HEAT repeat protein